MAVIFIEGTAALAAGREYSYYLSQLPKEQAYQLLEARVLAMGLENMTQGKMEELVVVYLEDENVAATKFTEFEKFISDIKKHGAFEMAGKSVWALASVSLIWLNLCQIKKTGEDMDAT